MNYVYKLNLGAKQVESFKGNTEVLKKTIVNAFNLAYDTQEEVDYIQLNIESDVSVQNFNSMYEELKKLTKQLLELYRETIDIYKQSQNVLYSKDFLYLNEKCSKIRNNFVKEYPILTDAEKINDEVIINEYEIPTEYQVGKGIYHLLKFYKIDKYIEEEDVVEILNNQKQILYDYHERFYIKAKKQEESIYIAKDLEKKLNQNDIIVSHLGKIRILPFYTTITFEGDTKNINFVVVYPNGAKERNETLYENQLARIKEVNADEGEIKFSGQDVLDLESVQEEVQYYGEKGYLKEINAPNTLKIFKVIKKIRSIKKK